MRKSRVTEAQMVTILGEADKGPVAEVAKKHGISDADDLQLAQALRRHGYRRSDPALGQEPVRNFVCEA